MPTPHTSNAWVVWENGPYSCGYRRACLNHYKNWPSSLLASARRKAGLATYLGKVGEMAQEAGRQVSGLAD